MDAALLYPVRKRCARCRRYFGFLVLAGLWCSYECAGHPEPSEDPADWPREHYVPLGFKGKRGRRAKRTYDSRTEAEHGARTNDKDPYQCGYCLTWHIGKSWSGDLSGSPREE